MKNQYLTFVFVVSLLGVACGNNQEVANSKEEVLLKEEQLIQEVEETLQPENLKTEELIQKDVLEEVEKDEEMVKEVVEVVKEKNTDLKIEEVVATEIELPLEKAKELVIVKPNHQIWDGLLKQYVTSSGKVNYKGMKSNIAKINGYLGQLAKISPKSGWTKNEKLAYWINLYNASTVYLIASNYPVTSINKINGGKPWDKKFVKSGEKVYTLNQIENDIVRPRFKDPRIHAALNCAAISCPKILNKAFLPAKLNAQLDMRTKSWINSASSNKLSASKVEVSKIFEWYADDFKASGGTIGFINKYATTKVNSGATVTFLEYDWTLNE